MSNKEMAPAVRQHPGARTKRSNLLIEKRIAQPHRDDQEALGVILEMMERVERKAEALIEPKLRDVLEPGIGDLIAVISNRLID